jgi:ABC-type transport system substrate-binding protein
MLNRLRSIRVISLIFIGLFLVGCSAAQGSSPQPNFLSQKVSAPDCSYGGEIKSIEAVDEYTVQFTLCTPDSAFPAKIASPIFAIQDSEYLSQMHGDSELISKAPNGTGSYVLKEWRPDNTIVLTPSETYWGVPAVTQRIEFRWEPDQNRRFSEYDFTQIEGMDFPSIVMTKPFTYLSYIYNNPNLKMVPHSPLNLYYIGFNNRFSPFDNPEVRKAFAIALDREKLIDITFPGGTELAQQLIPTMITPGRSLELKWHAINPDEARNMLEKISFNFDQEITLAFINAPMQTLYSPAALASEIKNQLEAIGVKIVLKPLAQSEFEQSLQDGNEMFFINWYMADYQDGVAFFEKPFISQASYFGNAYSDLQQGILQVRSEGSPINQQTVFDRLNQTVLDEVPLIPIGHSPDLTVFRSSLKNVASNAYFENLEDVVSDKKVIRYIADTVPLSLWPTDEENYATFRVTRLLYDTLLSPGFGDVDFEPLLAESWTSNADLTEWTFLLRYNVQFSNGSSFDANDVVSSFTALWDASDPNHKGRTGEFAIFHRLFGNMINEN